MLHEIEFFEYCERRNLPEQVALQESAEFRKRAFLIWSLRGKRAKVDNERQRYQAND